ncbi:MAG: hypothetical protein AVDCRST_MAG52-2332, partial [uncultured Blastococcus sp.]
DQAAPVAAEAPGEDLGNSRRRGSRRRRERDAV